ncbi:MAG: mobile mystery protein A [bacterium]|nr:mobile mystery protein A [bacterium]
MNPDRFAIRRQLDRRSTPLRGLSAWLTPHRGWIRAIRDALGMSGPELATRLGVRQQTIHDLELSEQRRTIQLATLARAADAMDCDLVYAFIPRTSLEEIVRSRALRKATEHLGPIAHHSRLEDQAVGDRETEAMLDDLAERFIDRRGLWTDG